MSGTTATGTLDGTTVTATFSNTQSLFTDLVDLSDTAIFDPPGSDNQQSIVYSVGTAISWTFGSPVSDPLLDAGYWRGFESQGPTNTTYVFNASPSIVSGLTGSSIVGNSLTVGDDFGDNSGILKFAGPLTSLTLAAPVGAGPSLQLFTVAVAVPEPSTVALGVAGLACGGYLVRRRSKRA